MIQETSRSLRPEQQRALDYLRRKGTEAPAAVLREATGQAFGQIEAALAAVPPALRAVRPGPGRWSVQEVVDHLVESHRPAIAQLGRLLAGEPPGATIPAGLQSADPLARGWDALVADLKGVHAAFLAVLDEAPDGPPAGGRAPVVVVVKAAGPDGNPETLEWIEELDWKAYVQGVRVHTLEHQAQIARTLAVLGGET